MTNSISNSALSVPGSRIRELAEIAMGMDGVLKLYFGECDVPTPEFLQDTPDHDRLWFEQRPPKDFDFDE